MFWIFAFSCLVVFVGILLWCGTVNHIERQQRHELELKRLEIKAAKQAHEQWMEENHLKLDEKGK
jgi:hypothetical protein